MDLRTRLGIAGAIALVPLFPLTVRLAHLQVMQHEDLKTRATGEFERSSENTPPRGSITDRKGHILAESYPSWSCFIDKKSFDKGFFQGNRKKMELLTKAVGIPWDRILNEVAAPGRFINIKKGLTFEQASSLNALSPNGVGITANHERIYPNGPLGGGLLGKVGRDGYGLSGLELTFNDRLQGTAGKHEIIRDGKGQAIYDGAATLAEAPAPLALTIDRSMQYYTEKILRETVALFNAKRGVIAIQDPNTGEILALADYPSDPLRNSAIQDPYEPGSTMKIVAALASLEEKIVSITDQIATENGSYEIAPKVVIHDHIPTDKATISEIMEHSSNIGIAKIAERIGPLRFYRYCQALGFVNKTGIPLPGESAGMLRPVSDMTRVTLAAAAYGYGISINALQLIGAYSAIANGGTLYQPRIIQDGQEPASVRRIASQRSITLIKSMLESAVERGTGAPARIPGYRVAGKTGTTRKLDPVTRKYSQDKYISSFIGFVPASRPKFSILVVIDEPQGYYYGSQVAAPVFSKLGSRLLALQGVPPDGPLVEPTAPLSQGLAKVTRPSRDNALPLTSPRLTDPEKAP